MPILDETTNGNSNIEPKAADVTETQPSEEPSTHTPVVSAEIMTEEPTRTIPPALAGTEVVLDAPILPTTVAAPPEKVDDKALETVAVSQETGDVSVTIPEVEVNAPPAKEEKGMKETTEALLVNTAASAAPATNGASTPAPPTPLKQRFPSSSGVDDGTVSVHSSKSGTPRKKKLSFFGKIKEVFHGAEEKLLHHGHNRKASSSTTK